MITYVFYKDRHAKHSINSNVRDLIDTIAKHILLKNSDLYILLNNIILESMKKVYKSYIMFNATDIIACQFIYQYRATSNEAVTCVHILLLCF